MPNTGTQIIGTKDIRGRRPRMPQRSRLGKTWQDRLWREQVLGQLPSGMFRVNDADRVTKRRALPVRH